jgi:hypothetical protein
LFVEWRPENKLMSMGASMTFASVATDRVKGQRIRVVKTQNKVKFSLKHPYVNGID